MDNEGDLVLASVDKYCSHKRAKWIKLDHEYEGKEGNLVVIKICKDCGKITKEKTVKPNGIYRVRDL